MSEDGQVKVTDSLKELYGVLDEHVEGILQSKFKASCTKGCASCCYLLATITFTEGLLIAEKLLEKPDWKSILPKLRAAAMKTDYTSITKTNYFRKGQPCVFLGEDKTCTIYDIRPACCRYHIVASAPENCSFLAPETTKTISLDLRQVEEHVWGLSMRVTHQLGKSDLMIGPLALMVLACMEFITDGAETLQDKLDHEEIKRAYEGLRTPQQWMVECGRSLIMEEEGKQPQRLDIKDIDKVLK